MNPTISHQNKGKREMEKTRKYKKLKKMKYPSKFNTPKKIKLDKITKALFKSLLNMKHQGLSKKNNSK